MSQPIGPEPRRGPPNSNPSMPQREPKTRRILVTGATGFIGRALIPALVAAGYGVRAAVRGPLPARDKDRGRDSSAGTSAFPEEQGHGWHGPSSQSLAPGENGAAAPHSLARSSPSPDEVLGARAEEEPRVEHTQVGDIGPGTRWNGALRDVGAVVHLAARVHVMAQSGSGASAEYQRVNTVGTERLALAAAETGVRRFVFLSTVKVHGEATGARAFTESDPPLPQDAYARSKWEAEQALRRIGARTGMEVVILRPPLVYGPGVKANFFSLLQAIARGLPLPIGAIDNRRSLIFVGNLADAIVKCIEHPAAAGGTFLVRDGEDLSTPELARRLARALDVRPRLLSVPPSWLSFGGWLTGRRDAVDRLIGSLAVDDSKIRAALGWGPPYTLDEGLAATARWFLARTR